MKIKTNQEFIVACVAGFTGFVMLAMSWSDFKMVAKDHPAVVQYMLGLVLLFMAVGFWSTGLSKRSWMKQMIQSKEAYDAGKQASSD